MPGSSLWASAVFKGLFRRQNLQWKRECGILSKAFVTKGGTKVLNRSGNRRKAWIWITALTCAVALLTLAGAWWVWAAAREESARLVGAPYFGSGEGTAAPFPPPPRCRPPGKPGRSSGSGLAEESAVTTATTEASASTAITTPPTSGAPSAAAPTQRPTAPSEPPKSPSRHSRRSPPKLPPPSPMSSIWRRPILSAIPAPTGW